MRAIYVALLTAAITIQATGSARGQSAIFIDSIFQLASETVNQENSTLPGKMNFNLPLKTSTATQVWTDRHWREGYRIQENALTGHFRLLDSENIRRGWGTREQCQEELDRRQPIVEPETPKHYLILLHGLMRTSGSMKVLETRLNDVGINDVIRFSYASTRKPISEHAAALREVVEGLPEDSTFSFVGHSMGNIVTRHALGDWTREDNQNVLPRCKKMVMLGPPNQGAAIARRLAPTKVFEWVTGKGGMELGAWWNQIEGNLATPPFPFHIITGDVKTSAANPLVDGKGDFIVSLEEAKLDGAESFHVMPCLHSFLMEDPDILTLTTELLAR